MDEKEIIQSIVLYKEQLSSIQNLYKDDIVNHHEFVEMEQALLDIIKLKEESLIAMKKSKLLLLVDDYLSPQSQKELTTEEEYKFRVKFSQYVQPRYHDAVLFDDSLSDDEIKVLFTHPIVEAMKPCYYFMEGSCHNEQCRFSHGFIVSRSLLLPYHEPNYVNIKPGMLCLVENVDTQLWYIANIEFVDYENQKVIVKPIQSNQEPSEVAISSIRPLDQSDDTGNESPDPAAVNKGHHTLALPQINPLYRPIKPDNIKDNMLGDWEVHTRGIGSHLLQKMGFTEGQGLGKYNQGIKEPVKAQPIKRLSHKNPGLGKSSTHGIKNNLAKISPNTSTDLYGQFDEDNGIQSNTITPSVFTYINTQLKTSQAKEGNSSCVDKPKPRTIATDKELRIMEIKLDKDIVQCRREVAEIRGHLKRHSPSSTNKLSLHTQNVAILTLYEAKLKTANAKLERLESKVQNIRRSQDQKEERKRLRIF